MQDLIEELEFAHKNELRKLKLTWEGIKLEAEKEKLQYPELSENIDNYLEQIKSTLYNFLTELADDEEEKQELIADALYVFGEDNEINT